MTEQERMTADAFRRLVNAQSPAKPTHPAGKRCVEDGIHFDSMGERDYYRVLKADPTVRYIDVHPSFTLPGFRFTADFMVHRGQISVIDFKGRRPGTDFNRIWAQFNQLHPLAPLIVVKRDGKGWKTFSEPPKRKEW